MAKTTNSTLPSPQDVAERIREGLDHDHLRNAYRLASYAAGGRAEIPALATNDVSEFPDFPDVVLKELEIGVSRRIQNNQFISMSRVLYAAPKPRFPQVRPEIAEVRSQFFTTRFQGDGHGDGEWQNEIERLYQDGDGIGLGAVLVGTAVNPETGKRRVTIKHVRAWQWAYDRHQGDPCKAKWMAFQHYMRPEEARALYKDKADAHVVTLFDTVGRGFKVVKAIEYWDSGIAGNKPCHMIYLGSMSTEPVLVEENPHGCIPVAVYVHQQSNTRRRPTGRIELQMPIHEDINDIERKHRMVHKRYPMDLIKVEAVDGDDLRMWAAGNPHVMVKVKDKTIPINEIFAREPSLDINPGEMQRLGELEQELTAASGITDADRGNLNPTQRTATENSLIDARSQVQGSWTKRQTILFYKRLVYVVLKVAALYDRDPVMLEVRGHQVLINDPSQPASYISEFLKDYSRVEIDDDALDYRDVKADRFQRLQEFTTAFSPLLQLGTVDPLWYSAQVAEIMGEDPTKILKQPTPPPPQPPPLKELLDYKDAPPSIQAQIEQRAGFQPAPEHERYLAPAAMTATQAALMQSATQGQMGGGQMPQQMQGPTPPSPN